MDEEDGPAGDRSTASDALKTVIGLMVLALGSAIIYAIGYTAEHSELIELEGVMHNTISGYMHFGLVVSGGFLIGCCVVVLVLAVVYMVARDIGDALLGGLF